MKIGNMSDNHRVARFLAGVLLMRFIFSFTAYGLTTYDTIRHVIGDVAAQPEQTADLQTQYNDMISYFSGNTGDTYTYQFRSSPIDVTKAQVTGKGQDAVIGMMLDTYANQFYNNNVTSGGPGEPGVVISKTGNQIYGIVALVTAIGFIAVLAWVIFGFRGVAMSEKLKGTGKSLMLACVFAFALFILVPLLVKTLFWSAIVEVNADDLWTMAEPTALTSLLQNTGIALVLAIIVFVAGLLMTKKSSPAEKQEIPGKK